MSLYFYLHSSKRFSFKWQTAFFCTDIYFPCCGTDSVFGSNTLQKDRNSGSLGTTEKYLAGRTHGKTPISKHDEPNTSLVMWDA